MSSMCPSKDMNSPRLELASPLTDVTDVVTHSVLVLGFSRASGRTTHLYRDCKSLNKARYVYERRLYVNGRSWVRGVTGLCKTCVKAAMEDNHPLIEWDKVWAASVAGEDFVRATRTSTSATQASRLHITDTDKARAVETLNAVKDAYPELGRVWTCISESLDAVSESDDVGEAMRTARVRSQVVAMWGVYRRVAGNPIPVGTSSRLLTFITDGRSLDVEMLTYGTVGRELLNKYSDPREASVDDIKSLAWNIVNDHVNTQNLNIGSLPERVGVQRDGESVTEWLVREWTEAVDAHLAHLSVAWHNIIASAVEDDPVMCTVTADHNSVIHDLDGGTTLRVWDSNTRGRKVTYTVPASVAGYLRVYDSSIQINGVGEDATLVQVALELYRPGHGLNGDLPASIRTARLATAA